jgi:type IV secretory pathway VirB9-like protein
MNVFKPLPALFLAIATIFSAPASAAEGLAVPGDKTDVGPRTHNTRLVTFAYDPNVAFAIRSRVGVFTNIEVPEGESITSFYISDETTWQWHVGTDKRRVLVRPNAPGELNTATLVTNARTYEITLESVEPGELWHQRVRWAIPGSSGVPAGAGRWTAGDATTGALPSADASDALMLDMSAVNLNYQIEPKRRNAAHIAPTAVFDDGVRTYFQFPPHRDVPAIFASDKRGKKLDIVEFAVKGPYMVVPHTSEHWTLILGNHQVAVSRR